MRVAAQYHGVSPRDIDRKRVPFSRRTRYVAHGRQTYLDPRVFVVKSQQGRLLFNDYVRSLPATEALAEPIRGSVSFPYYVLSVSWLDSGHHHGLWQHCPTLKALEREVDWDAAEDDFMQMALEFVAALKIGQPPVTPLEYRPSQARQSPRP